MDINPENIPLDPDLIDVSCVDHGPGCVGCVFDGCSVFLDCADNASDLRDA